MGPVGSQFSKVGIELSNTRINVVGSLFYDAAFLNDCVLIVNSDHFIENVGGAFRLLSVC